MVIAMSTTWTCHFDSFVKGQMSPVYSPTDDIYGFRDRDGGRSHDGPVRASFSDDPCRWRVD